MAPAECGWTGAVGHFAASRTDGVCEGNRAPPHAGRGIQSCSILRARSVGSTVGVRRMIAGDTETGAGESARNGKAGFVHRPDDCVILAAAWCRHEQRGVVNTL